MTCLQGLHRQSLLRRPGFPNCQDTCLPFLRRSVGDGSVPIRVLITYRSHAGGSATAFAAPSLRFHFDGLVELPAAAHDYVLLQCLVTDAVVEYIGGNPVDEIHGLFNKGLVRQLMDGCFNLLLLVDQLNPGF